MDWLRKVPVGQYVDGYSGWMRKVDPRVKLSWVLMFLLTPVLAGPLWRIGLVVVLFLITFTSFLPLRIWWRGLFLLLIMSLIFGLLSVFLPTGYPMAPLNVRSTQELSNALISSPSWELWRIGPINLGDFSLGPLVVDRRSAALGIKTSTLIFTVIHSVNLMLLTTSPEDLMWALRWFISPLAWIGAPVERMSFQLLLALRFLPLAQEEFQNLIRSFVTRSINLRSLGFKGTLNVFLSVGERLLANILLRSEQGAEALLVRGGLLIPSASFKPKALLNKNPSFQNIGAVFFLLVAVILRGKYGYF